MNKKLSYLGLYLLAILVIFFISLTLSSNLNLFIIYSGSMEPHIPKGSIVLAKKPDNHNLSTIKNGTIITFEPYINQKNSYVTHRINKISNNQIYTKGDYNTVMDSWSIKPDQIKGLYLFHLPYLGYGLHFLILYPWYLLIILGIIITFPVSNQKININWPFINRLTIFILPLVITLWTLPAYAQFNTSLTTNDNSFSTDTIYNYISLKNSSTDDNYLSKSLNNDYILNLGSVNKHTDLSDLVEIKNITSNNIRLEVVENSTSLTSWFSSNNKQTIIIRPQKSTKLSLKINKNKPSNSDYIELHLNDSNYYTGSIQVKFS